MVMSYFGLKCSREEADSLVSLLCSFAGQEFPITSEEGVASAPVRWVHQLMATYYRRIQTMPKDTLQRWHQVSSPLERIMFARLR
ncbi:hypothetical protein GPECTOR_60g702 [Gonium pectorale]|uniref:Uncharacterized protein n=1 Tax=Gonium pectorale TaxID=33097 RepID=A0A150G5W2_GONPE|nr:hypothetical protein GPECTOR_60g702 [Gonium pectorale]|eukprot:KXZ44925.1 hypothetical protein GPECTOR_60g702 [Gonium pectorale]